MSIRKITLNDREIYKQMAAEFYGSDAVSHSIPTEYFDTAFKAAIEGNPCIDLYILEFNGEAAGYSAIANTFTTEGGGKTVWLDELYIREKYRGKGLGSELIDFLKSDSTIKRIRLEITAGNEKAKRLYKSKGFEECDYRQLICEL